MQGVTASLISSGFFLSHGGTSIVSVIKAVALAALLALPLVNSTKIICFCENRSLSLDAGLTADCNTFCKSDFTALPFESGMRICENYVVDFLNIIPSFDPSEDNYKPEKPYIEKLAFYDPIVGVQNFQPLESALESLVQMLPDPTTYDGFKDFRRPNEAHPEQIRAAFDMVSPGGLLISPGSERGLFTLGLAEEGLFSGLVIRDIHPKIKAYNDFNILLFRLATSLEEYNQLSAMKTTDGFREKITASNLSEAMKTYYLSHLDTLAFSYQEISKDWRDCPAFHRVDYCRNEVQFRRIKKFADAGNIVSVVGEITDIDFLSDRKISMIDISNIYDFFPEMNFKRSEGFHPVIVYTNLQKSAIYANEYVYLTAFYKYIFNQPNAGGDLSIGDFSRCKRMFGP